jgi:hypothetical protein
MMYLRQYSKMSKHVIAWYIVKNSLMFMPGGDTLNPANHGT